MRTSRAITISPTSRCYTTVCLSVRGDNPRALTSGLSPVRAVKLYYNCFHTTLISVNVAPYEVYDVNFAFWGKGGRSITSDRSSPIHLYNNYIHIYLKVPLISKNLVWKKSLFINISTHVDVVPENLL